MKSLEMCNKAREQAIYRINNYKKKKENNIFDDFYTEDLDFFSECMDIRCNAEKMLLNSLYLTTPKIIRDLRDELYWSYYLTGICARNKVEKEVVIRLLDLLIISTSSILKNNIDTLPKILENLGMSWQAEIISDTFLYRKFSSMTTPVKEPMQPYVLVINEMVLRGIALPNIYANKEIIMKELGLTNTDIGELNRLVNNMEPVRYDLVIVQEL